MADGPLARKDVEAVEGLTVRDRAGEEIGAVEEVFYDRITGEPEWIGVRVGLLRRRRVMVPVLGAERTAAEFVVDYPRRLVADAPDFDADALDAAAEDRLYGYYGLMPPARGEQRGSHLRDAPPPYSGTSL